MRPRYLAPVAGLFFLSGAAGLVYQVLWMRQLGLFFGSDMYSVATVLAVFMGGLALGSLGGGRLAQLSRRPLLWYGVAELGIGVFALCFASLLRGFEPLLRAAYPVAMEEVAFHYQLVRIGLASAALLVPTTLMGTTLPLIVQHFVRTRAVVGETTAFLYAVNTLGALAGTLAAGFALLPYLGTARSTALAAAVNLAIGSTCALLGARARLPAAGSVASPSPELDTLPDLDAATRQRVARAALVALGVSGVGSFALEVVWTRVLVLSFSATVYAFASMLGCFLFGIVLGSLLVGRVVDRHAAPLALFASLELGAGASVAALCLLTRAVPGFFERLLLASAALAGPGGALLIATLAASFLLLVVPATLLGATFAVALRAYTTNVARVGGHTGRLYFANTLGAIVGSLGAGLFLVPVLGTQTSMALIAVLFTATGLGLAAVQAGGVAQRLLRPAAVAAAALGVAGVSLAVPYRVALNFNQGIGEGTELLYHAEGVQNTIDVVRSRSGITSLVIGGNVEANDEYTQLRHFILKGHLPLLFMEEPRSVLVIGLGMGITLRSTLRHDGIERVDVIELSPEILEAQRELREINGDVARNPAVHVRIDDGRNFLEMTDRRFDLITADPIHPKISRVGYLYTREYFEAIDAHLSEKGVVCQWMPLYQMSPTRLRSAIGTFLEVFPQATLWHVENHALLVAQRGPLDIDWSRLERKFAQPRMREDFASIDIDGPEELLALLLMGPDELRAFVDDEPGVPLNTDDHPYLEYFVPRDLFLDDLANMREIVKHLVDPTRLVGGLPPERAEEIEKLIRGRERRLVTPGGGGAAAARGASGVGGPRSG